MRSFWFHYNKPASRAAGEPRLTVHFGGACHLVKDVSIMGVKLTGRRRKTQPYFVLAGRGACWIEDGIFKADAA